jgi:hypothetical protein
MLARTELSVLSMDKCCIRGRAPTCAELNYPFKRVPRVSKLIPNRLSLDCVNTVRSKCIFRWRAMLKKNSSEPEPLLWANFLAQSNRHLLCYRNTLSQTAQAQKNWRRPIISPPSPALKKSSQLLLLWLWSNLLAILTGIWLVTGIHSVK